MKSDKLKHYLKSEDVTFTSTSKIDHLHKYYLTNNDIIEQIFKEMSLYYTQIEKAEETIRIAKENIDKCKVDLQDRLFDKYDSQYKKLQNMYDDMYKKMVLCKEQTPIDRITTLLNSTNESKPNTNNCNGPNDCSTNESKPNTNNCNGPNNADSIVELCRQYDCE